ncbi:MAG: RHS repeat domain-containing protein, partial [Wenzhouxiangellaceae bacterium]
PNWNPGACADAANGAWNDPGKIFVGCARNTWDTITIEGTAVYPYLATSEEWSFAPVMAADGRVEGSNFTHLVVTETRGVDRYGNVGQITVSTHTTAAPSAGATAFARQQTVNQYRPPDLSHWRLGRLGSSVVTSARAGEDSVTRIATFGYDPTTGILNRETVNAGHVDDPDGSLKTEYALDTFGNRITTEVTGADLGPSRGPQTRRSKVAYESTYGRFVTEEHVEFGPNHWLRTRRVITRDAYGNATEVEDGQGVTAIHAFDLMGRLRFSADASGAGTEIQFFTSDTHCPWGTALVEKRIPRGGAWSLTCKDALGRETRRVVQGFAHDQVIYVDTEYDFAARPVAVSEPYSPAGGGYCQGMDPQITPDSTCRSTPHWTHTGYDVFGRPVEVITPDLESTTVEYSGLTETRTNPIGQRTVTTRNVLGETVSETRHPEPGRPGQSTTTTFSHDALGQLVTTDGPMTGDAITLAYDPRGHKIATHDPDTGSWYYDYDGAGQLRCQRDAEGNTSIFTYDALGRRIRREDFTGTPGAAACATGAPAGTTEWVYGNVSGQPEFGQLIEEQSQSFDSNDSLETELTRSFFYDDSNNQPDPGGRVRSVMTTIGEQTGDGWRVWTYTERTDYDAFGRVFQRFDASGDYRGERYEYTHGYLRAVREARYAGDSTLYQRILAVDARGNAIRAALGNGTVITRYHDGATGEINLDVQELPGLHHYAVFREYSWDAVGRMTTRAELSGVPLHEVFEYDGRNRLTAVWSGDDPNPSSDPPQQRVRYGLSGNIECKSDVYGADCSGGEPNYHYASDRPHAVTQVVTNTGTREFDYDYNGSVTQDRIGSVAERRFEYTAFNKLRRVCRFTCGAAAATEFHYGPDRARFLKRELDGATVQGRTHYLGSVEIEFDGDDLDSPRIRRVIAGVAIEIIEPSGIGTLRYQHKDHLGSTVALSTSGGQVLARMHFDPWGQRQNLSGELWNQWHPSGPPIWADALLAITPRGFTGHEHLDDHGIIHMNGRIYDPRLGRFLQADPFIEDTGTLNRYTYVHNN